MRIRLLIDVETNDIERLQKYVGDQPVVHMKFDDNTQLIGRFVGAKEAHDATEELAIAKDPA